MKKINKKYLLFAAMAAVIILTVNFVGTGNKPATTDAAAELVDAKGKALNFEQFRGKVVFVNNWASWCPPCVAEMPSIQNLKKELQNEDIVFVMVSFDQQQEKAFRFIDRRKFDFDVFFPGERYPFITESIPATYLLDKNGRVVKEHVGMAKYDTPQVIAAMRKLISE
jgi:thiol-disulfide isomerase/thioredoxin